MKTRALPAIALAVLGCGSAWAQFNSGSTGRDGAFHPTADIVLDMADHPDGIYHYTNVYIPSNVTVTFIPNANNTPVVWLVQSNVVILGTVDVSGQDAVGGQGGRGGPGGFRGGNGGTGAAPGQGPGGGAAGDMGSGGAFDYGNQYLLPLIGGSGGGGSTRYAAGGGGGGGALLIASSGTIHLDGWIVARGGSSVVPVKGGGGSGGAVRLVAPRLTGSGGIDITGGAGPYDMFGMMYGGSGRVRFDALDNNFGGWIRGAFTRGLQFVIFPSAGQMPRLRVVSVGGVPVSETPTGQLAVPDAVLSAQQNNPIPVVVRCERIPLGTTITVVVKPALGPSVSATGVNNAGTFDSSTATVLVNIPRGGGWIYATAAVAE
jgi:hypothetical protein